MKNIFPKTFLTILPQTRRQPFLIMFCILFYFFHLRKQDIFFFNVKDTNGSIEERYYNGRFCDFNIIGKVFLIYGFRKFQAKKDRLLYNFCLKRDN